MKALKEEKVDRKVADETIKQEAFDRVNEKAIVDIVKFGRALSVLPCS